jgi:hypothetical protein
MYMEAPGLMIHVFVSTNRARRPRLSRRDSGAIDAPFRLVSLG